MKKTRTILLILAGVIVFIASYTADQFDPMLFIFGLLLMVGGSVYIMKIPDFEDAAQKRGVYADPCKISNHAGCQDDPTCECRCHLERIEVKVNF